MSNIHDAIAAGTHIGVRKRLLIDDQVREIRKLRAQGWSQRRLAARFGANVGSISRLVHSKTYLNVK